MAPILISPAVSPAVSPLMPLWLNLTTGRTHSTGLVWAGRARTEQDATGLGRTGQDETTGSRGLRLSS